MWRYEICHDAGGGDGGPEQATLAIGPFDNVNETLYD